MWVLQILEHPVEADSVEEEAQPANDANDDKDKTSEGATLSKDAQRRAEDRRKAISRNDADDVAKSPDTVLQGPKEVIRPVRPAFPHASSRSTMRCKCLPTHCFAAQLLVWPALNRNMAEL